MKKPATLFVGLDVHKDSISVAHVPDDRRADVHFVGRILVAKGKHPNVIVTAIARELAAFMWAIAREVPITS